MQQAFPENFIWGAATSAHQVEGNNRANDWWQWEQNGHTEPSGRACGHYDLFREDIKLARKLDHNAHRFGLEWSRLESAPGVWVKAEWDHYKSVLQAMRDAGLRPVLTLNHFTLPLWISSEGGWLNEKTSYRFGIFCEKAVTELAEWDPLWITINEPNILAMLCYHRGIWPPCEKNIRHALEALANLLKAHVLGYEAIKSRLGDKAKVGLAKAVTAFHPCRNHSVLDRFTAHRCNKFHNHAFLRCALEGRIRLPMVKRETLPLRETLDFIGVNYYFRQFVRPGNLLKNPPSFRVCPPDRHKDAGPITDMGWEVYPPGLYEVLQSLKRYGLPLMITENGIATRDDTQRISYIRTHLKALQKALSEGVPVMGYLHWSLLDNFEWAEGFTKKFGLVEVEPESLKRIPRPSAIWMSEVIRKNCL